MFNFFGKPVDFKDHKCRELHNDLWYDTTKSELLGGKNDKKYSVAIWVTKNKKKYFLTKQSWGWESLMESYVHNQCKVFCIIKDDGKLKEILKDYELHNLYNKLYALEIQDA